MDILLTALLSSIAIGGIIWNIISKRQQRNMLAMRMSDAATISSVALPNQQNSSNTSTSKNKSLTLDESLKDPITRNLFIAGHRTQAAVIRFKMLRIFALGLPILLIVYQVVSNELTQNGLLKDIILGVACYFGLYLFLNMLKKKRQKALIKSMPQFFDLLVIALEAGISFTAAIPRITQELDKEDYIAQEFDTFNNEYCAGLPFAEACTRLSLRCDVHDLSVIMNSLIESEQLGSSVANVLRIQAAELRDKIRQRTREKAHQIPVKLMFPMTIIFTTLFVITLGPLGNRLAVIQKEPSESITTADAQVEDSELARARRIEAFEQQKREIKERERILKERNKNR